MISGVLVMGWSKREFWVKGRSLSGSFRGEAAISREGGCMGRRVGANRRGQNTTSCGVSMAREIVGRGDCGETCCT